LLDLARRERATLVGFDFAYGYPRGFARSLGLQTHALWRATWDYLASRIEDNERNQNNRFALAAAINQAISGRAYPFWGCPTGAAGPCLKMTRPTNAVLPAFRLTEQRQLAVPRQLRLACSAQKSVFEDAIALTGSPPARS